MQHFGVSMEKILIQLDEGPVIAQTTIDHKTATMISRVIKMAVDAVKVKDAPTERVVAELLNSPDGLPARDILTIHEAVDLSPTILKIRKYLKKDNLYTLEKRKRNGNNMYYLKDSKMVPDNGPLP